MYRQKVASITTSENGHISFAQTGQILLGPTIIFSLRKDYVKKKPTLCSCNTIMSPLDCECHPRPSSFPSRPRGCFGFSDEAILSIGSPKAFYKINSTFVNLFPDNQRDIWLSMARGPALPTRSRHLRHPPYVLPSNHLNQVCGR